MKSKITILVTFIILVSFLITMNVIFHESLRGELATMYNQQQVLVAKGISNSLEATIDKEVSQLKFLANILSEYSVNDASKIETLIDNNFINTYQNDVNLMVFNSGHRVIFSTKPVTVERGYFAKAEEVEPNQAGIYYDTHSIYAVSPVFNKGELAGGVLLNIELSDLFAHFLSPFRSMENGYAWVMDGEGDLLYHPIETSMVSNNLFQAGEECFTCHRSFELEKKVLQGPVSTGSGRHISPSMEDKVLAFSKFSLGSNTWIVCVSSPYTEVISVTETSMKLYSWLVVAIFATVFLGASLLVLINRQRMQAERSANEAIILEKRKMDTIVSAIGAGLMLVDKDHKIIWTNEIMNGWTGDVIGENCNKVCPECPQGVINGETCHEIFNDLFGMKRHIFQITSAPTRDMEGNIIGVLKLTQDITEIKKLEEQVLHSEKLAAIGRLAAGVAHEIGNPLTSISSFVQILKGRTKEESNREHLETIHHHIQRISQIVRQMSQFSKLPELNIKRHDVNRIIASALEIIRFDRKLKKIELTRELAEDLPEVYVDDGYLVQVLVNLILNASDAIGEDSEAGTITVRSSRNRESVVIEIADNGSGISDDNIRMVFDPFFTTKEKGTGLGLPISYEIVKKFGGELEVASQEGEGSLFTINLPIKGD